MAKPRQLSVELADPRQDEVGRLLLLLTRRLGDDAELQRLAVADGDARKPEPLPVADLVGAEDATGTTGAPDSSASRPIPGRASAAI